MEYHTSNYNSPAKTLRGSTRGYKRIQKGSGKAKSGYFRIQTGYQGSE
jgi:hypothetical protein